MRMLACALLRLAVDTSIEGPKAKRVLAQNLVNHQAAASKVEALVDKTCTTSKCIKVSTIASTHALTKGEKQLKLFVLSRR